MPAVLAVILPLQPAGKAGEGKEGEGKKGEGKKGEEGESTEGPAGRPGGDLAVAAEAEDEIEGQRTAAGGSQPLAFVQLVVAADVLPRVVAAAPARHCSTRHGTASGCSIQ